MKKNDGFITVVFAVIIIFFAVITFIVLGVDLFKTTKNGVGWVWQDRNGVAVKQFLREENGCIYFIDVWDNEGKTCGTYRVENFTKGQ